MDSNHIFSENLNDKKTEGGSKVVSNFLKIIFLIKCICLENVGTNLIYLTIWFQTITFFAVTRGSTGVVVVIMAKQILV